MRKQDISFVCVDLHMLHCRIYSILIGDDLFLRIHSFYQRRLHKWKHVNIDLTVPVTYRYRFYIRLKYR